MKQFLSKRTLRRKPSAIRTLLPLTRIPNMLNFAGGMPNPATFPVERMEVGLTNGESITLTKDIVNKGLQYGATNGMVELVDWIDSLQKMEHGRSGEILITNGSQSGLVKAFEMLLDEDDVLLVEDPTYSGALAFLEPLGCELEYVPMGNSGQGLDVDALERHLVDRKDKNMKMPKALYTIPTGQNPSGATIPSKNKERIYELAQKYNFLILEDDPYYYLKFQKNDDDCSFYSLDKDGDRVIRFDSFSKILSSGLRLGIVTGPKEFMHYLNLHQQATELHASGISQAIAYTILNQWGHKGFYDHVEKVQNFYRGKKDCFIENLEKYAGDYVEYSEPDAGMFIWMKLKNIDDAQKLIETKAREEKILMVPGLSFSPNAKQYVRASFSMATEDQVREGMQRFGKLLSGQKKKPVLCASTR